MAATTASPAPAPAAAPSPALAPPPGNPRFPLFDALRGIAVLGVVVFHVASLTGAVNDRPAGDLALVLGAQGPLLFFVISGFLLYRPYVAARAGAAPMPRTARFARRRVLRVVPAYWLALTVLAVFPGIVGAFGDDWWRYYFLLQLYDARTLGLGIPVAWTLCVEASFYLALPLWALAVRRLRPGAELPALALLAAAGAVVQILAARQEASRLLADSLAGQSTWFALGMALAVLSVLADRATGDGRPPGAVRAIAGRPGLCWLGAAAALAGLVSLVGAGGLTGVVQRLASVQPLGSALQQLAFTALLLTLVVLPAVFGDRAGGLPRRVMAWPPLLWLGLVSYGVYLWHLTVAELLALPADPGHFSARGLGLAADLERFATPILVALTLAVTLVLAAASYYLVELPFLRRKEPRR